MSTIAEVEALVNAKAKEIFAKAEPTFTRSKGGTAEREEIISQIQVPDLWELYIALKDGNLTRSKQVQARWADTVLETWHLSHDMKRHLQSNRCNTEPSKQADWYAPDGEPYLVDCKDCYIVHAIGEGRNGCIDGGETRDRWFTNG